MNVTIDRNASGEDLAMVERIYLDSFPAEERRDWADVMARSASGDIRLGVIKTDGMVIGLITVWRLTAADYVEHFALSEQARGCGLGSMVIRGIAEEAGERPVVLEVEPAGSTDMAQRRIGFYERCGFSVIEDFDYRQPPYGAGLPWVDLKLMTTRPVDAERVRAELHSVVYGFNPCPDADDAAFRDI